MDRLNLPDYAFRIFTRDDQTYIFDTFRKKNVILTPEEWVRQNFLQYLLKEKNYPESLISVEMGFRLNKLIKRGDIVVFNRQGNPLLLVECKAPSVKISQKAFNQIARYNMAMKVKFLIVTNGLKHYCCKLDFKTKSFYYLTEIPDYFKISK